LFTNNEKENISFKNISKKISIKYGYEINESLHFDDIYTDNILSIYEKFEEICFDYFKEILKPVELTNEKDKTIEDYLNNLELIKKDEISKAAKKYLMRYCLGDYDKKENILKNMKIDKMFLKKDIWEEKMFNDPKFKEESEKLKKLNNENDNYIDNYFLYNIINASKSEEKDKKIQSNPNNDKHKKEEDNSQLHNKEFASSIDEYHNNKNEIIPNKNDNKVEKTNESNPDNDYIFENDEEKNDENIDEHIDEEKHDEHIEEEKHNEHIDEEKHDEHNEDFNFGSDVENNNDDNND
jgi:hypothetical protein